MNVYIAATTTITILLGFTYNSSLSSTNAYNTQPSTHKINFKRQKRPKCSAHMEIVLLHSPTGTFFAIFFHYLIQNCAV